MIGKILGCFLLLGTSLTLYSQNQYSRFNDGFVISVNNELSGIDKVKLILNETLNKTGTIEAHYIPGNLFLSSNEDKKKLYSDSIAGISLTFENYEYHCEHKKGKQYRYNYLIKIDKEWLKYNSIALKVQDLNKRNNPSSNEDRYSVACYLPGGRGVLWIVKR